MDDTLEHRQVAGQTYNAAWTLLESDRSAQQDRELLTLAFASRYHWAIVGGPAEAVISDWMVSRCCAAVGEPALAVRFAEAALAGLGDDAPAWLRASVHEGMARACAAAGNTAGRETHVVLAQQAIALETDAEDRALILAQIANLP
jgi:hypothetical protein